MPLDRAAEKRRLAEWLADNLADHEDNVPVIESALDAYAALVGREQDEEIARLRRFIGLLKQAASDVSLNDAQVRSIVRYLSAEPISKAEIERGRELADRFGWARDDAFKCDA